MAKVASFAFVYFAWILIGIDRFSLSLLRIKKLLIGTLKRIIMADIILHELIDDSDELGAAKVFQMMFESTLSSINGKIWIIPSVNVHSATGRHDLDILIIGWFENSYKLDSVAGFNDIDIRSFCTTIEVKSHSVNGLTQDGTHLLVSYGNELEDVTQQSDAQKFTLKKFLRENLQYEKIKVPFITNIIMLMGAKYDDLDNSNIFLDNVIASDFRIDEFFEAIARQHKLVDNGYVHAFRNHTSAQVESIASIFCAKSDGIDTMTLRRMNLLQQGQELVIGIEKRTEPIIVLSGHAGTGKTMMLLQAADRLSRQGKKCLFLTYNTALLSDLTHSIQFMPNNQMYKVELKSMYRFFSNHLIRLGLANNPDEVNANFDTMMGQLNRRLSNIVHIVDFDYIFVDEAQDWKVNEVDSLKKLCKGKHLVIADGVDQFMKSSNHSDWGDSTFPKLKVCLRQRMNLTLFAQIFAHKLGVHWDVMPNQKMPGGKVIVIEGYEPEVHQNLLADLKKHGCTAYDMMLLAPPSLAEKGKFALADVYKQNNVSFYDGIDKHNRDNIYSKENAEREECRIYQYASCRGLEAWTVVCLRFHELFEEKHPYDYSDIQYKPARNYMLALWTLIPLTRAIDTLVLVVNPSSEIARILKEISEEHEDYVTYKK